VSDAKLKSPREWAAELRDFCGNSDSGFPALIDAAACMRLADRMDDLTEALRLLRVITRNGDGYPVTAALLSKYEED